MKFLAARSARSGADVLGAVDENARSNYYLIDRDVLLAVSQHHNIIVPEIQAPKRISATIAFCI